MRNKPHSAESNLTTAARVVLKALKSTYGGYGELRLTYQLAEVCYRPALHGDTRRTYKAIYVTSISALYKEELFGGLQMDVCTDGNAFKIKLKNS